MWKYITELWGAAKQCLEGNTCVRKEQSLNQWLYVYLEKIEKEQIKICRKQIIKMNEHKKMKKSI